MSERGKIWEECQKARRTYKGDEQATTTAGLDRWSDRDRGQEDTLANQNQGASSSAKGFESLARMEELRNRVNKEE